MFFFFLPPPPPWAPQTWGGSGPIKETRWETCWEPWGIRSASITIIRFMQNYLQLFMFLTFFLFCFLHLHYRSITTTSSHQRCRRLLVSCPKASSGTSHHGFHGYWCTHTLRCKSVPMKDCFTLTTYPPMPNSFHKAMHSTFHVQGQVKEIPDCTLLLLL